MRKPAILLITAVLLITGSVFLSACQGQTQTAPDKSATDKTLTIVTSFYPMYITAINIAKDVPGVKVVNMTPPVTGCLHDYQLKPDDLKTLSEAQIFVVNGAGMESFMDKVVSQLPDLKIVDASKGIPLIKGDGEEGDNPHLWVSISNAIQQVNNIGLQLAALDPEHAAQYSANTTAYADQLEALRVKMHQTLDGAQKRDIITFHEAFPYFAREFNLNIAAVIEREPGSEPSAAELADTIEIIEKSQIKALFAEPQYSATAAETIARETGAQIYILDPAVTGDMEPDAYLKIMETNMKTLEEALN
ncbi:MAG: High-affinity zinc uptake system binding-protein ZnuA precursor [Pelotomaculum sp. PtaU1.Bin065]|nr:MAG: High-affinity zinc uptake system binding-protein ZnuA precursor [Pelotomaculum sp. PtaU1.Bin065]